MGRRTAVLTALAAILVGGCGAGSSASTVPTASPSSVASVAPTASAAASVAPSVAVATSRPTAKPLPTAIPRPTDLAVDGTCEPDHTCLGLLKPGKYHTKVLIPGFSFAITEPGWENIGLAGGEVGLLSTTDRGDAIMVFWKPRPTKADGTLVSGVDSDVAALGKWLEQTQDVALTNGANVTVGGLKGKRWDVAISPTSTARDTGCPTTACVTFMRGSDRATWEWDWGVATSERERVYLLDRAKDVVVIAVDSLDGTTFDALTAKADKILASMKFDAP